MSQTFDSEVRNVVVSLTCLILSALKKHEWYFDSKVPFGSGTVDFCVYWGLSVAYKGMDVVFYDLDIWPSFSIIKTF